MNDDNTIDLGSITIDLSNMNNAEDYYSSDTIYTSSSSDTITLGDYSSGTSNTFTLDSLKSGFSDYNFDWFEDQRIVNEYNEEKAIRESNPGIQEAWEQYKILVELAKNPPENLDKN